jgi:exoribonuclease II
LFPLNSLLLYKNRPARLLRVTDRIEVELENGEVQKVRPKDIVLLHPGPLSSLADLKPQNGEIQAAWELLSGGETRLPDLAELAYGSFTPATAWAAWQHVIDGFYFEGAPERILARSAEEVQARVREREQAAGERRSWQEFLERLKHGTFAPQDQPYLKDVETLALGRGERSQVLRALGRVETPDNAHALLLEIGAWTVFNNPYPERLGVDFPPVDVLVPPLESSGRLDLTHLPAFAIDDEGTDTPDDALSLEGSRIWVHVADVAAMAAPDSPLDLEARARALTPHPPEGARHLLPRAVIDRLGLGLSPESPALSFGIDLSEDGQVTGFTVTPSRVRVTRLSYEAAEQYIHEEPLATLERRMAQVRERRRAGGAVMIDFPEVKIHLDGEKVVLHPLQQLHSRAMVEEAMILTGAETARFAMEHGLRMPFSRQEAAETAERPTSLSGMFGLRRLLKRSRFMSEPGAHSGLGVPAYTQVTSPLRRYLDLVGHQQLRAFLLGQSPLPEEALVERIGAVEAVTGGVRQAEILSEKHWTLVYLLQNPGWHGEGILVEKRGASGILLLPALGMETRVHLPQDTPLDTVLPLRVSGINLAQRDASFRIDRS